MSGWVFAGAPWEVDGERLKGPSGEVDLSPAGAPGAQDPALGALVAAGLGRRDTAALRALVARLAVRPYRADGQDVARVDAVRAQAAWLAASVSEPIPGVEEAAAAPLVRGLAAVAAGGPDRDGWAEVAGWLAGPSPRWVFQDQVYELGPLDRPLMWVGLYRSVDVEAFAWYRAGVVLLDAALELDGRLDDACREAWARRLEVRPGPRDWRTWHDELAAEVPWIHARRTAAR